MKSFKLYFCLIFMTLFTSSLLQAIDCSKAKAKIDGMICLNRELLALDKDLNDAFAISLLVASTAEKQKLVKSQKEWLLFRDSCAELTHSYVFCLKERYQNRLNDIKGVSKASNQPKMPVGAIEDSQTLFKNDDFEISKVNTKYLIEKNRFRCEATQDEIQIKKNTTSNLDVDGITRLLKQDPVAQFCKDFEGRLNESYESTINATLFGKNRFLAIEENIHRMAFTNQHATNTRMIDLKTASMLDLKKFLKTGAEKNIRQKLHGEERSCGRLKNMEVTLTPKMQVKILLCPDPPTEGPSVLFDHWTDILQSNETTKALFSSVE